MLCRCRWLMFPLLSAVSALAQPYRQDPIQAALQAAYRLRGEGNYDAAVARREEARALLEQMPVDAPNFPSYVQQVTQIYQQAGKTVEVRSILQSALARSGRLAGSHPARLALYSAMAGSWQNDGSLLKAAACLETAVSALDAAPNSRAPGTDPNGILQQLARLYRQLGQPKSADAILARLQTRLQRNPSALASFYEGQGQLAEAEALYRQMADDAHSPMEANWPLQSLARVYARDDRPGDAAAAIGQAIDMLEGAGSPAPQGQLSYLRQALAGYLQQADRNDQAEAIYRQMLSDPQGDGSQAVFVYANYLNGTQRASQAAKLLSDYLDNHPDLPNVQQMNLLYQLANMQSDPDKAAQYRLAAEQKRPPNPPAGNAPDPVGEDLQSAQKALGEGRLEEAFSLSIQAIGAASSSARRDSMAYWGIPQMADEIGLQQPARAEELYRCLLATVESWSADTVLPLEAATASYARFLSRQPERQGAALAAVDRYRSVVSAAQGEDAGTRAALDLSIDTERTHRPDNRALFLAQEKLRLEESLSGPTSQPYLAALQALAALYQQNCDAGQALPLYRQMIALTDLTTVSTDPQRDNIRLNAASLFASQRQFDEAELLANEAIVLAPSLRPRPVNLDGQLNGIRQMEKTAQANPAAASTICGVYAGPGLQAAPRIWYSDPPHMGK